MSASDVPALPAPSFAPIAVSRVVRVMMAAGLVLLSVYAAVHATACRMLEARLGGVITRVVFGRTVRIMTGRPIFAFERSPGHDSTWFALQVTAQCSALYFLIPLALIAAFVLFLGRSRIATLVLATVSAGVLLEVINMARIELLVLAAVHGGSPTFDWVHDTVGSAAMLAGFTLTLFVFFRLGFFGRRDRRSRPRQNGDPA